MTTTDSGNGPGGVRLDSWKAISDYLKVEVRSVQRWEAQRGLPVHRVPGEKRGRVFAYTSELDEWLRRGSPAEAELGAPNGDAEFAGEPASEDASPDAALLPASAPEPSPAQESLSPPAPAPNRRGIMVASLAATAVLILAAAGYLALRQRGPAAHPQAKPKRVMLAVLPFANLSGDPKQDYFADGLTEEMITDLGRLNPERLGVIARTSAMQYKGTKKDIAQIGRELGVNYILEGSIRRQANEVRISAQLIQVSDRTHLWAQNYQRQMKDVLSVQQDVAQNIADHIQIDFGGEQSAQAAPGSASAPAPDTETYDAYLQGLYCLNRRSDPGITQSVDYFTQAIRLDPRFAPAYAALAQSQILLAQGFVGAARQDAIAAAQQAAARAIQLDPASAEAHTALGGILVFQDYNLAAAQAEFRRALSLNPNYAPAHHWYANLYLDPVGRTDEAIAEMKMAQELDPANLIILADLGQAYFFARQYDKAFDTYKSILAMDPNFLPVHWYLADYYRQMGRHEGEVREVIFDTSAVVNDTEGVSLPKRWPADLRRAYASGGYPAFVAELRRQMSYTQRIGGYVSPMNAVYDLQAGDTSSALDTLERCYATRNVNLIYMQVYPAFNPLHSNPRFQALARRLALLP